MKNKITSILFLATISLFFACSKEDDKVTEVNDSDVDGLVIQFPELKNNNGIIVLDLTDDKENSIMNLNGEIQNNQSTITISNLAAGKYAFKYFHDENSNNELDVNAFGIPAEGYGFSNNASGTFGPPKFNETIFEYNGSSKLIICSTTYFF